MWCESAHMTKESVEATFLFRENEESTERYKVEVYYENTIEEHIRLSFFPFAEKKDKIAGYIKSMAVYIPEKEDAQMFFYMFQHLASFYNYAVSLRMFPYPGKELIIVDYGVFSIEEKDVNHLAQSITSALLRKKKEIVEVVKEEEETVSPVDEIVDMDEVNDYPMPFMTGGNEFIKDDFQMGEVTEDD